MRAGRADRQTALARPWPDPGPQRAQLGARLGDVAAWVVATSSTDSISSGLTSPSVPARPRASSRWSSTSSSVSASRIISSSSMPIVYAGPRESVLHPGVVSSRRTQPRQDGHEDAQWHSATTASSTSSRSTTAAPSRRSCSASRATPRPRDGDDRGRQAPDLRGHSAARRAAAPRPAVTGVLVDEQFGAPTDIPAQAKAARPQARHARREVADRTSSTSSTASEFGEHILAFDPDFSKVLVRYNPDGPTAEMNERQLGRLKRLADWLHEQRPQVPLRAAGAGRPTPSSSRSAATATATTRSCVPS